MNQDTTIKTTICADCGVEIKYKTNKPKRCEKCKEDRATSKRIANKKRKRSSSATWQKEYQMFNILDEIFPNSYYIRNGYYSFLISPKGEPMQLDIYYPDLRLAVEYDGRQHTEYNAYFHKSKAQFKYLQDCDALKNKLCAQLGITLIRIPYDKKLSKEYIIKKLKEVGFK
jgi:copper oxidase (laccase) domain-containing protein